MIPGSAPHIWENNLESDKRRDTALLLELLCLCAKKKEPLAALFCSATDPQPSAKRDIAAPKGRENPPPARREHLIRRGKYNSIAYAAFSPQYLVKVSHFASAS